MEIVLFSSLVLCVGLIVIIIRLHYTINRFRNLVDNTTDIIFLLQLKPIKKFKYISKSVEKFCGYSQKQFYLNPDIFIKLTHPDDYPLLEFATEYPLKSFNPIVMRWRKKDGSVIWIEQQFTNIIGRHGSVHMIEGVIRNISHQKKEEFSLREMTRVFKEIFYTATDCILLYQYTEDGISGKLLVVNEIASKSLEYSHEEILDHTFSELLDKTKIPLIVKIMKSLPVTGKVFYETELIARNGQQVPVEINANITKYQNKTVILSIARNISLRKQMETELLKNQKLESIGILAGGLAHDFNNYLSVILGNIDLAMNYLDDHEKIHQILLDTEKAILKATGLTHQLLTFSKGGMPIKQSASITDLLKETAIFDLRGVNIQCEFDLPEDLWPVEFDIDQMNQVLNNLIINARQAMPDGGKLEIKAENINLKDDEVPLINSGKYIRIKIRDNGIGIPKENLVRIFDPFFTTKENGSGLGLTLSYSIIKKHAGMMQVESDGNSGTTFTLYLPALDKKKAETKIEKAADLISGSEKILVLDDEAMIMKTLGKMLEFLGYKMGFSTTGEDTIRMYQAAREEQKPYDAVIMDLTIQGGMGGEVAIRRLLEIDPDVCAIVSSGYSTHPVMARYREYGFKNVICKPYTIKKLSEVLSETISEHKKNEISSY